MFGRNKDVYIFKEDKPPKKKRKEKTSASEKLVEATQQMDITPDGQLSPTAESSAASVQLSVDEIDKTDTPPKSNLKKFFYKKETAYDEEDGDIDEEFYEPPAEAKHSKKPKKRNPHREKTSFFKDKKKIGLALIIVSLLVILVIAPMLNVVTASELTTCVVANGDIEKGVLISSDMLSVAEVPAASLLPIHIKEKNLAVGKYAKTDIAKDELLSTPKLTEALPFDNSYLYTLPVGKKAVSTMLPTLSSGLSSKLQSGDIISIYANLKEDSADNQAILPPELCFVKVLAVTNNQAFDLYTTPEKSELESPIADTLVLEVSDTQARVLIGLEMNAQIHAALVSRGDEALAAEYLKQQDDYFLSEETEVTITDEQSDSNMG